MMDNSDMFEASDCFDPNSLTHEDDSFPQPHVSNFHQIPNFSAIEAPGDELHHRHLITNMDIQQHNWTHNDQILMGNDDDCLPTPPPDLLNLFQLPRCSSSICFSNPTHIDQTTMYDPLLPLNLPPHPPFVRELLNSLPNGFNFSGFGEMDMERGDQNQLYHDGDSVLELGEKGKETKHFASEKHRRQQFNGKFEALKELVPNPTKADRASLVGYAIEYINELKRTVEKLKILVEKKRCNPSRIKRRKTQDDSTLDVESIYTRSNGDPANDREAINGNSSSTMRSSWLQRKSNNTEIDVRIVDDEVTIKLVQQKKMNCLLLVSKVLDELQLDLHHVAGGVIGDFYSYLFNSKICEGSSVYASAIANKVIEVVDKQYAT
ncbi:transcription factor bHLH91-like [Cynara cardunculus var. scolymus]|uniref:transcription factor bHLH91-like n=1 Tax=Cynara cardunculus var. scolymus TaxID=59895 RepID=UPI000D62D43B|nr:transcription factor bHLH91-like [Cynara cardunculus var. scolymus]